MNINIGDYVVKLSKQMLGAYRNHPALIRQDHGSEQRILAGGYAYRQILELVQNGADAVLEAHDAGRPPSYGNRIEVLLRGSNLYVANTGEPLSEKGAEALLLIDVSPKRGRQIGRFGEGFKSLLRLGGRIDLFTKASGAIRFDPRRCRAELMEEFGVTEAPGLRLAWPLDESERTADPVLSQLSWAETIVRAEVAAPEVAQHLRQEIDEFPVEFVLFFSIDAILTLDNGLVSGSSKSRRELRRTTDDSGVLLHDGFEVSRWLVATRDITVTDERALADATHIHARDVVPLAWAVPLDRSRERAGTFWAFFPTNTATHLSGILNAPWALTTDRSAIRRGEWNSALMREAGTLVAETIPLLSSPDDTGRPLDAFPRQVDRNEDAATLVEAVWKELELAHVIPDGNGTLRLGSDLLRHPTENVELARQWEALAGPDELSKLAHSSCLDGDRRSRLDVLAKRVEPKGWPKPISARLQKLEAAVWFDLVASTDTNTAIQVLKLAEAFKNDCKTGDWDGRRRVLRIIPSCEGRLLTANEAVLAPEDAGVPDRIPVAPRLNDNADAKRILRQVMNVQEVDDQLWESILTVARNSIRSWPREAVDAGWNVFWERLRLVPDVVRQRFLGRNTREMRVRRRDGTWASPEAVLFPGALVSTEDSSPNQNVLVDCQTHCSDEPLLKAIGVVDYPQGTVDATGHEQPLRPWRDRCRDDYKAISKKENLEPAELRMPRGWGLLPEPSDAPNAELTRAFVIRLGCDEFPDTLDFGHRTMSQYERIPVCHPLAWFLLKYGTVLVGKTAVSLRAIVATRDRLPKAAVEGLQELLPHLDRLSQTEPRLDASEAEVRDLWLALIDELAVPSALADGSLRDLWSGAAGDGVIPDSLRIEHREVCLEQIFATASPDLARRVRSLGQVAVALDDAALKAWLARGARDLSDSLMPQYEVLGQAELLMSAVPEFGENAVLHPDASMAARCQRVSALQLRIDDALEPIPCLMWQDTLLIDNEQLQERSRAERLKLLLDEVAVAGWLGSAPADALQRLGNAQLEQRRAEVKRESGLAERLLVAVGGRSDPLRQALGGVAAADFTQECTPLELAALTLAQLGPATLPTLQATLDAEGLKPPSRWGSSEARVFVEAIGFPSEFAASPVARRDAEESISGPIRLRRLHDFQRDVFTSVRELIRSGQGRRRAVVSLPTGAGKTRVTVEAAVRLVLKPEGDRRSVIWVAQTDELCEQAVQAFRQVWINLGALKTALRIVRLWGGNPSPAIQEVGKPVVVVASIQTLNSRIGVDPLAWLQKPGLVVVDECHHAITASYTRLLRGLDAELTVRRSTDAEEPPILGLSATPFRTDDDESRRLAKRFDGRWFPPDQEGLHSRLVSQGILAQAEYVPLRTDVSLLPEEIEQFPEIQERWEGLDFERLLEAINQRLADIHERNQRLVQYIQKCSERSILFFSNSVRHADEISARLNLAGVSAAAISGETLSAARRYFLERFQRGDIRVLCNYNVLSTGFDAPKTDMVLIARQVFSRVRYMQMVGRGLRGRENGGKDKCLIVTVLDNLDRFEERHPYYYCQEHFH